MKQKITSLNKFKNSMENILIIFLLIALILVTQQFMSNWHSIDSNYNLKNIQLQINDLLRPNNLYLPNNWTDSGSDLINRPVDDYYISSMNGLKNNFLYAIILSLLLGILLSNKFELKKHE